MMLGKSKRGWEQKDSFLSILSRSLFRPQNIVPKLFSPIIWSIPFLLLIALNLYQIIALKGNIIDARMPFIEYRQFHSYNVIIFSLLWIWTLRTFKTKQYSNLLTIYLGFTVLFSAYGFGEVIAHLLWSPILVSYNGFFTWFVNLGYPIFFLFNNVPLFLLAKIKLENPKKDKFIAFLIASYAFYVVAFFYDLLRRGPNFGGYGYATSDIRFISDGSYLIARTFSVLAYIHLIKRAIPHEKSTTT